ncbi:MAG: response regulator [Fibrobacter sp.]|nr:response regulator [Fibrobacter sp.]
MKTQESKRIVVVDDTQSVAFILKSFLEEEGYNIKRCGSHHYRLLYAGDEWC